MRLSDLIAFFSPQRLRGLVRSSERVRRPIYTEAVERRKRYEKHLAPLIEALRM